MKKILALLLAAAIVMSFAACNKNKPADNNTSANGQTETSTEATDATEAVSKDNIPTIDEGTFGATLWAEFEAAVKANPNATAEDVVKIISTSSSLPMQCVPSPVNAEWFAGLKEGYTPKGYKDAFTFGPMIGSIPFIGYVFNMEEGTDMAAFVKELNDNADPAWNVCVTADQVIVGSVGNMVYLLMCPASVE